jgi:hypothetical protein
MTLWETKIEIYTAVFKPFSYQKKSYAHFDKVLEFGRIREANIHHFIKMIKPSPSWETKSSIEKRNISSEQYSDQNKCRILSVNFCWSSSPILLDIVLEGWPEVLSSKPVVMSVHSIPG